MPKSFADVLNDAKNAFLSVATRSKPKLLATNIPGVEYKTWKDYAGPIAIALSKAIVAFVGVATLMIGGTWAVLVGTIISAPLVDNERLVIQRSTWVTGDAPIGEVIAAIEGVRPSTFFDKVAHEVVYDASNNLVLVVIAQPGSDISAEAGGRIMVDGARTRFTADRDIQPVQIMESYLALCVAGSCGTPGTPFELPIDKVIGSVKGTISLNGIQAYKLPEFLE